MGGSDLCEWSYVGSIWNANALTYARDLGRLVGCGFEYDQKNSYLVECLAKKHYEEMVNATAAIINRVN
jgi:Carboxylesterase family